MFASMLCSVSQVSVIAGDRSCYWPDVSAEALRQAALGQQVMVVQFLSGGIGQGPSGSRRLLERLEWVRPDIGRTIDSDPTPAEAEAVAQLWNHVEEHAAVFEVLVLDDVGLAIQFGLIQAEALLELLACKRASLAVVLCGAMVPESVAPFTDTWTEICPRNNAPGPRLLRATA